MGRLIPVEWTGSAVRVVDQTLLPGEVRSLELTTTAQVVDAIARLAVRGAPTIGVCGAFGVALAARNAPDAATARADAELIAAARPTAVNLRWAVEQTLGVLDEGPEAVLERALAIRDDAVAASDAMGALGADLLLDSVERRPMTVHTHCNAGGLAAMGRGSALGVIEALHERSALAGVLVDETRPLWQGARLTAFELGRLGIAHRIVVDGAGPYLLAAGHSHAVVVGADRIAANGDVANKVGTFALALGAQRAGVPFVVVAPESTLDPGTPTGADIPIEQRAAHEVLGDRAPAGADALNLAFDVTPADLVTAIVTERRVIRPGG